MNWMKKYDLQDMKEQINEIRNDLSDYRLRKPWTNERSGSSVLYLALGAGIVFVGQYLFKKRREIANYCTNCGERMGEKWQESGLKETLQEKKDQLTEKAKEKKDQALDKAKEKANQMQG